MLFEVDENLHSDVVALLRHRGHDTESGRQQGLPGQLDAVCLQTERGGLGLNVAIDRVTTESMCRREGAALSSESAFHQRRILR
jgi:hypothetical protein